MMIEFLLREKKFWSMFQQNYYMITQGLAYLSSFINSNLMQLIHFVVLVYWWLSKALVLTFCSFQYLAGMR